MKNILLVAFLFVALPGVVSGTIGADWVFEEDGSFDIEELEFFDAYRDVLAVNGKVFVCSSREHCVTIFDECGKRIGNFGRKGQGPGDLYSPHGLSLLEGKYLLVGDYALKRRVSLFDLNGKFIKTVKTKLATFSPVALRKNKFAYLGWKPGEANDRSQRVRSVIIKDIESGAEQVIKEFTIVDKGDIKLDDGSLFKVGNLVGELLIKRDHRGDLVMGLTSENTLHFYNVETGKTESLTLDIEQKSASAKYIASFKEYYLKQLEDSSLKKHRIFKVVMARLQNSSFREFFDDHLPYYSDIIISSTGDIVLVIDSTDAAVGSQVKGMVISRDRKTQTRANLKIAPYQWPCKKNFKNISISGESAYCLVTEPDKPDSYRLKRFRLNKAKTDK